MKLARIAVKFVTYLYFLFKYLSQTIAIVFAKNNVPLKASSFVYRKGKNLHFTGNKNNLIPVRLLKSFNHPQVFHLITLLNRQDVSITHLENNSITLRIDDIDYPITSGPNLAIMNEIFTDNNYKIFPAKSCVLLDIGMNVGYASLYFSSFKNIRKIYSFEPFTDTFNIAQRNINSNASAEKKITAHNYGISNYSGTIQVPLLAGGSVIASTEESFIRQKQFDQANSIQVSVRDILEVLEEVKTKNSGESIALKIDCEGEEYNILESLNRDNHLENVIFLCIEWHFKGPDRIKEILIGNGFTVFEAHRSPDDEFGMLYGFRNSNP